MSKEKIFNLKAMGAQIVLTRSDVAKGHPQYYQDLAATIAAQTPGAYFINQFANPNNPKAHYQTTAPEIFEQLNNEVDAIVFGVGSSGTVTGLSQYVKEFHPKTELILADPVGSILAQYINEGVLSTESGSWKVEGIGEDFLPSISDFSHVTKAYAVSDAESFAAGRELLCKEGVLGGSSTGTLMQAALKYCQEAKEHKNVVVFVCDTGNKYLSKMYNDYWMMDNGYIETKQYGDLRDLISRPYQSNDTIVMRPSENLATVYQRMKLYDVSQMPVMDGDVIVGIIDESDVLMKVFENADAFNDAVETAMTSNLEFLSIDTPLDQLMPIFDEGKVAIVKNDNQFLGLITRIDLLNYLRRVDTNQ
jgi:cystathionine beta-synthase